MLLLAAYAAITWYAIFLKRRTWSGLALLILSLVGVAVLAYLDLTLHRYLVGGSPSIGFQLILASEAFMILAVGTMLLVLPRERAAVPCRACGYELRGLDDANPRCPECGLEHAARRPRAGRCVQCDEHLPEGVEALDTVVPCCERCAESCGKSEAKGASATGGLGAGSAIAGAELDGQEAISPEAAAVHRAAPDLPDTAIEGAALPAPTMVVART